MAGLSNLTSSSLSTPATLSVFSRRAASSRRQQDGGGIRDISTPVVTPTTVTTTYVTPVPNNGVTPPTPTVITTRPVALPSYRVSLWDAMKFNGPAPELINGRLAMVGLLLVAAQESSTGMTALQQLSHASIGATLAAAVIVYASMVPVLAGAKMEPFGPFTPKAEITNGRAAMLGWAVLLALEYTAQVPFF